MSAAKVNTQNAMTTQSSLNLGATAPQLTSTPMKASDGKNSTRPWRRRRVIVSSVGTRPPGFTTTVSS